MSTTTTHTTLDTWLPALDGVVARLRSGAIVADLDCGDGRSTIRMAQAFPRSAFTGFDEDPAAVTAARTAAQEAVETSLSGRNVRFEAGAADEIPLYAFDLVTSSGTADLAMARRVRHAIAEDGTWMLRLGADADVAPLLSVLEGADFGSVRLVAETADDVVLEVRP